MTVEEHSRPCDIHAFRMKNHSDRLDKIDEILEKVRNRPPIWVTIVIGVLLGLLGFLASQTGGVS